MTYEYLCTPCNHTFDVIKSVREIDQAESCPKCQAAATRMFAPRKVYFSGTSVQNPEWNPGLGCVVKDKRHRAEIAKQRGLVEVGSDYKSGESMQKEFDTAREVKRTKEWEAL